MTRMPTRTVELQNEENTVDSEIVPSSLAVIVPILRAANEIEQENPRVAYLCRFHAFEKAHTMDPNSSGRGVRQFKTYLLHRLEREGELTERWSTRTDTKELLSYYQKYYEENVREGEFTKNPEEMAKIIQIATVLYDVLTAVVPGGSIDDKTKMYAMDVENKRGQYEHYNILPLYAVGVKPAIMELSEIKAALHALRKVDNLPMPIIHSRVASDGSTMAMERVIKVNDILDWLSSIFGFQVIQFFPQVLLRFEIMLVTCVGDFGLRPSDLLLYVSGTKKGNVANQREHLILLLANMDIRNKNAESYELQEDTVQQLKLKIFKNYNSWCHYVRCKSNLRSPEDHSKQQLDLIYIALYLLIWGEASNIRFMPECICYIFHHMCNDVYGVLYSNVHPVSGDTYQTAARDEEFLKEVITPIYEVLTKEAKRNNKGKASHTMWRNYDDLNEYFWSDRCFKLGWPMKLNADFFRHSDEKQQVNEGHNQAGSEAGKKKPKTNFVEVRTFFHLYRSFDRMWKFFILALQVMIIVAWSSGGPLALFLDDDVFRSAMSIFITYAFLNFLQVILDIILTLNAWKNMKFSQLLRYFLKFVVAAVWVVVLPVSYSSSVQNPSWLTKFVTSWAGDWGGQSLYSYLVALYLLPNILAAILFFLPPLKRKLERSNMRIITLFMWWAQPKLYVGRGMHENMLSLLKYTLFWIMLLISKIAFSYYVEIYPLVEPTKLIMGMPIDNYQWHEFFPENETHNVCIVIAIWAPIMLVYFMDTQIWYSIYSTIFGGIIGAFSHLGEIRTLGMLRSRFESVPYAFSVCFLPGRKKDTETDDLDQSFERRNIAYFSQVWNEFISSMRDEDLISNRDRDLLLVPYRSSDVSIPIALDMAKDFKGKDDDDLFRKIRSDEYMYSAVAECYETLRDIIHNLLLEEEDKMVVKHICDEVEMSIEQRTFVRDFKMSGLPSLSEKLEKFLTLLRNDDDKIEGLRPQIVNVLQDIVEIIIQDVMIDGHLILETPTQHVVHDENKGQRFANIDTSLTNDKSWKEKVIRLHLLLTVKESAINVPQNLEARRRITFFANSLFMNMPKAPKVRDMLSFSVLTPYYKEDVLYSDEELNKENEDGISILFYLKKIYPDEWTNFLDRLRELKSEFGEVDEDELTRRWASYRGQTLYRTVRGMMYYRQALDLQCFLEYAGDKAIFDGYRTLDFSEKDKKIHLDRAQALADLKFTYVVSCQIYGSQKKSQNARDRSCYTNILNLMLMYPALRVAYIDEKEETVDGKSQKVYYSVLVKGGDKYDEEIYRIKLPGSPTEIGEGKPENQNHAIIFTRGEALQAIDMNQTEPCPWVVIVVTTMDNYYEEAFKMRNVLEEFKKSHSGRQKPTILGLREHIFTGSPSLQFLFFSVSSLAWFMSNQETSFVTIGQRILANPLRTSSYSLPYSYRQIQTFIRALGICRTRHWVLSLHHRSSMVLGLDPISSGIDFSKFVIVLSIGTAPVQVLGAGTAASPTTVTMLSVVEPVASSAEVIVPNRNPVWVRFHYGHPDIFDRIFHITRGGISKASKVINLSEDIFAGYNSTLRGGFITHHEYIQVGKGRDVGMNQISQFEAKVANGNGEQTLSRDVYRLGRRFDFYRMLSFYFTTVGFYFSSMVTALTVYVFLYGRLYMVLSGVEREILQSPNIQQSKALEEALATQSLVQLGFLLVLPMVMEIGLEKGFRTALGDFIIMQLQLAPVFFTFQLGTKAHYYGRTLLHGGSKYRPTGRGFVVFHAKFANNYRMYSRSHFVKGLEILILLIVYEVYGKSYRSSHLYFFITISMWFLAVSWLFAPFLFNPSGFDWQKTVDDWTDWKRWMGNRGGIGISPDKSWESWWEEENEHLKYSNIRGKLLEILLAFRFFMYQYGIVYHLDIAHHSKNLMVFGLSWLVLVTILIVLKMVSMGRRRFGTDFQLMFRILKALLFLGFMSVMTVLFVVCGLTISDLFAAIVAFMPSGWALILIAQACKGFLKGAKLWFSVKELARAYEYVMGLIIFMPTAILSWFPFVSEFQTRLLFNQAFSRGLQISMILAGKRDNDKSA
ncbi:callose synthase 7-like [Senna tora]|uniref:1,3-beta-glucan synthase n=1 Tax=Senna tora TaxID=362788 RepID=A0A835C8D8_9FABA|nr:callose synthase 7-like [Senna tora]